jgi:hypothetical protein
MKINTIVDQDRICACWCVWTATVVYIILFPLMVLFSATSVLVFDSPSMPALAGLVIIAGYVCVPCSIPYALCCAWRRFSNQKYKESCRYCLLPLVVFIAAGGIDSLVSSIR